MQALEKLELWNFIINTYDGEDWSISDAFIARFCSSSARLSAIATTHIAVVK